MSNNLNPKSRDHPFIIPFIVCMRLMNKWSLSRAAMMTSCVGLIIINTNFPKSNDTWRYWIFHCIISNSITLLFNIELNLEELFTAFWMPHKTSAGTFEIALCLIAFWCLLYYRIGDTLLNDTNTACERCVTLSDVFKSSLTVVNFILPLGDNKISNNFSSAPRY